MVLAVDSFMDVESSRSYIDELYSPDNEKCLASVIALKNSVIGSNRRKNAVIQEGIVPKLLALLSGINSSTNLKREVAITLGSLAKGTNEQVRALVDKGAVPILITCLNDEDFNVVEACLCCLRTIFLVADSPTDLTFADPTLVPHLIQLCVRSSTTQETVTNILNAAVKNRAEQELVVNHGLVPVLAQLLCSQIYKVQVPTLRCLATISYENEDVSNQVTKASFGGKSIPDMLVVLMSRDQPSEMRLCAARCMTYMHRAGAITAEDPKILYKTLSCLINLCNKERDPSDRIEAAETLAYLIEVSIELQRVAAISEQLIPTVADYLKITEGGSVTGTTVQKMRQAAFKTFASLAANDEELRSKLIDTESFMDRIVSGMSDESLEVRLAAVRCLHSLSRSVQQLRTTFQDHSVWKPLMKLLDGGSAEDDILTVASSTLCNLLLEFSPAKELILEQGAVDLLVSLTHRNLPALKLNGVWGLMNMAFQADQKVKSLILSTLGTDHIFRLLVDSDTLVLMKTLGLLRNLLSTREHIDHIMGVHGKNIMQAVVLTLEADHPAAVKEQALCILANMADGDQAKDLIITNEDLLKKLCHYMMHSDVSLQIAAVACVLNLLWSRDEGAAERHARLRDIGIYKILQQLLTTTDSTLFEKVNVALKQFS